MMEKEETSERGASLMMMRPLPETEFFLQWGNKKRMRCVRIRSNNSSSPPHLSSSSVDLSSSNSTRSRRRITSRFLSLPSHEEKHLSVPPQPTSRLTRNSEAAAATLGSESRRVSPETEEERSSHTGGNHQVLEEHTINAYCHNYRKNVNVNTSSRGVGAGNLVWPKLCISLSSKEKEEDFLAMKGCKLPQRPKKRAKLIQRTILLVSPGAWLADMSLERYEVREKKTCKKRPRGGLKGMGNLHSDSD